jgi:hypothetical protein
MAATTTAIDQILRSALADVLRRVTPAIERRIAEYAAEELARNLALDGAAGRGAGAGGRRPRRARGEDLTRWVADRNARRVPKFVIEATGGLDTKKKIVARFGPDAAFEKGKPLPPESPGGAREAARLVKAKPPVVRRAASK